MSDATTGLNSSDMSKLFMDSLSKGVDSLDKHHYRDGEETKKLFGLLEMDSAIAQMAEVAYNTFIGGFTRYLGPTVYNAVQQYGKNHLSETPLNRLAAGTAFVVNTAVYAAPSLSDAYGLWSKANRNEQKTARALAPVLDDIKGKHGVGAYRHVTREENGMIAAHRWRNRKIANTELTNFLIATLPKIGPNIWFHERDMLGALKRGETLTAVRNERIHHEIADHYAGKVADLHNSALPEGAAKLHFDDVTVDHVEGLAETNPAGLEKLRKQIQSGKINRKGSEESLNLGGFGGQLASNATLTTLSNKWVESSNRRLKKSFSGDYTALDMVLSLQEQLGNDPRPRSFQLPGRGGRSLPLEAYVMEVMAQYQRDMADMDPEFTELREALKENVIAVARPLAAAIDKGDISALTLVNYIGGGKIIRNKGRMIATAEEVEAMIEHDAGKHQQRAAIDPKLFWDEFPRTQAEAKQALQALEGEERQIVIAWMPLEIRKQLGVSEKEGKHAEEALAGQLNQITAEAVLGMGAMEDAELLKLGMAHAEIKLVRKAASVVEQAGVEGFGQWLSTPAQTANLERTLLAVAVGSTVQGEKTHLGKILQQGRELLERPEEAANTHSHADKYRARAANNNHPDAHNDNALSHAERARGGHGHTAHERH